MNLNKTGKVFMSKSVGIGSSSYKKYDVSGNAVGNGKVVGKRYQRQ
jgi:hypothetical protein